MSIFGYLRHHGRVTNKSINLDVPVSGQIYFDVIQDSLASSFCGAYDLSLHLLDALTYAHIKTFGHSICFHTRNIVNTLAARIYYLSLLHGFCDIPTLLSFLEKPYCEQREQLLSFPQLSSWCYLDTEEAVSELISRFALFREPSCGVLFRHRENLDEITTKFDVCNYIKDKDYSLYFHYFIESMVTFYSTRDLQLRVYHVVDTENPESYSSDSAGIPVDNAVNDEQSPTLPQTQLFPAISRGFRYQQLYDSASFLIAMNTPTRAKSHIRFDRTIHYKSLCVK